MIIRFLSTIFLLLSVLQALCQEKMAGNASPDKVSWHFICEKHVYSPSLEVNISRTEKGGLLELTQMVTNNSFYIGGTVFIYLNDNTFIVCTDKGMHQNTEGRAVSYYNLTVSEMNRLRKAGITSIRFSIKGIRGRFDSAVGNFTAINRKEYFKPHRDFYNSIETEKAINQLYPN